MKNSLLLLSLCLFFNLAFAQTKDDKQLIAEFDKMFSDQYKPDAPGATALVARNGQIIYKKAFGIANLEYNIPMKLDNVFGIGSITKQFTAVAILQLMEQEKLSLQDDITKFIPDYPSRGYKITIEHLLTHTSGIPDFLSLKDFNETMSLNLKPTELINYFKDLPIEFMPGTQFKYSNSGYFLLGYIIEIITGKTYQQYLEDNIFKPIGMSYSLAGIDSKIIKNKAGAYRKDSTGIINAPFMSLSQAYSVGSIFSTVEDLFKWHQAIHSYKLVKKESIEKAFTKYKLINGKATDYGYGWFMLNIQGSPTIEHSGSFSGYETQSFYLPNEDVFIAAFSNCTCNTPTILASKIAAVAIGKPFNFKEISINKTMLQNYIGVFENEEGEKRYITVLDNQLHSKRGEGRKFKLKPYQKDHFFFEDYMTSIEFLRNKKGKVVALNIKGRQESEIWNKVK